MHHIWRICTWFAEALLCMAQDVAAEIKAVPLFVDVEDLHVWRSPMAASCEA